MHSKYDEIQEILDDYKEQLPEINPKWVYDIQSAIKYLNRNLFHTKCRVSRMRINCKIPQNNFSTRFKLHVGMTPASYISHHRIEAAKCLLLEERFKDISVSVIGLTVGYEHASTFATIFTKKVGTSPGIWRQKKN